jgi:hypothetical protein
VKTSQSRGGAETTKEVPLAASPNEELAEKAPVEKAGTKAPVEVDTASVAKVAPEPPKIVISEQPAPGTVEPPVREVTPPPEDKMLSRDAADLLKSLSALQALQSGTLGR